ncbi:MAG TPA: homoserine dehydrogenase [Phycisphaerae bacterium]|nr:homoserine dehydrogenase [Phycisphaerae bacterium]
MSASIGIALIGCGAVGREVARILLEGRAALAARTGLTLELRHVLVRSAAKPRGIDLPDGVVTADSKKLLDDAGTAIIVELAGGVDQAKSLIRDALQAGKDVVTANKALLALHGAELFAEARRAGRCIAFEASVCGGIPLIESVRRGLIANEISTVIGILNGTCNYILTRMLENRASYPHALAEAQASGFAEADPTLDVSGGDSAHKLTILASLAMRRRCEFNRVTVRGIEQIDLADLTAADELGYRCKLLAIARKTDGRLELSVQPTFIPLSHPLATVSGPFNAVSVYGQPVGHTFYYGRGAGGPATASAVISDIVDVALGNARRTFDSLAVLPDQTKPADYLPPGESACPHYIRLALRDEPGGIGRVATALGAAGISLATIVQHEPALALSKTPVRVIVTTHPVQERVVRAAVETLKSLDVVRVAPVCIPVLEEFES